ncbi:mono/diheme cytochrome c family protein [Bradyrhizobium sp. i1.15.2]
MLPWMASNCHAPGELPPKPAATTRAGAGATQGDAHWPTRWSQNATTRSAVLPARAVCSSWRRRRFGQARGGRSSSPTRTARPTRRPNSISYWRPDRKTGQGTTLISHFRPGRDLITPLVTLAAAAVLTTTFSAAQNLDAGKSPQKLFADGCATCHRSPRGLAKGRFNLTLSWFLKDHYATSSDTARALAAYLESVDTASPRAAAKPGTKRSGPRAPKPSQSQ